MAGAKAQNRGNPPQSHNKLPSLPKNAKVQKRPLIRPPIPSPHASASSQKVVYVSQKTPFMSAVKRVQKLLRLSDRRLIQSATTLQKQNGSSSRYRRSSHAEDDEIAEIAQLVEKQKAAGRARGKKAGKGDGEDIGGAEQVVIKGTGRAIEKVMMLALWFQQRTDEYTVQLRTHTTGTVDNIELDEDVDLAGRNVQDEVASGAATADIDGDEIMKDAAKGPETGSARRKEAAGTDQAESPRTELPATRIRYLPVLEVAISAR